MADEPAPGIAFPLFVVLRFEFFSPRRFLALIMDGARGFQVMPSVPVPPRDLVR